MFLDFQTTILSIAHDHISIGLNLSFHRSEWSNIHTFANQIIQVKISHVKEIGFDKTYQKKFVSLVHMVTWFYIHSILYRKKL